MPKSIISSKIPEIYCRLRGAYTYKEDQECINFLEQVAEGIAFRKHAPPLKIENALLEEENKNPDSEKYLRYKAIYTMHKWYLHPDKVDQGDVVEALTAAGRNDIIDSLDACLSVLKMNRITELSEAMHAAFKTPMRIRDSSIRAAAETLIDSGIPDLEDYAITMMAQYVTKGKYQPPVIK